MEKADWTGNIALTHTLALGSFGLGLAMPGHDTLGIGKVGLARPGYVTLGIGKLG